MVFKREDVVENCCMNFVKKKRKENKAHLPPSVRGADTQDKPQLQQGGSLV